MSTVEDQVRARIEAFVTEISALVRDAAMEAVSLALASGEPLPLPAAGRRPVAVAPVPVAPPRARPVAPAAPAPVVAHAPVPTAARGAARTAPPVLKKGEKRPPAFLAETVRRLYDHIKANPGQGIEQIGREMHVLTKDLSLPIKKLLADRSITAVGLKRATKYFPR
jgi:hypothetical protein